MLTFYAVYRRGNRSEKPNNSQPEQEVNNDLDALGELSKSSTLTSHVNRFVLQLMDKPYNLTQCQCSFHSIALKLYYTYHFRLLTVMNLLLQWWSRPLLPPRLPPPTPARTETPSMPTSPSRNQSVSRS